VRLPEAKAPTIDHINVPRSQWRHPKAINRKGQTIG
jgi:hypothetical protein